MGPILPVDTGSVRGSSGILPGLTTTSSAAGTTMAASAGLNPSSTLSTSRAVTELQSAVTQLLQSAGGATQNDKLLRLLIVALILMSLLQQMEEDGDASRQTLGKLGSGSGDRAQFIGIYTSSTTISIQQTSTTLIMGSGFDALGATGDAAQGSNGQIDVSA